MAHTCESTIDGQRHIWHVERLWEKARDLPVEAVPVQELLPILEQICCILPDERSCMHMARHAKRVFEADLSHPIILAADGSLFDGSHRIAKAWALGHETIQAVRFPQNPEPDEIVPVDPDRE